MKQLEKELKENSISKTAIKEILDRYGHIKADGDSAMKLYTEIKELLEGESEEN